MKLRKLALIASLPALLAIGCGTEVENHTNYGTGAISETVPFPDTFPPMRSPREVVENDTVHPPALPGNFDEVQAMELVFGLYDKNIECSEWVCTVQEKPKFQSKMSESGKLYSRSAGFFPFENSNGVGVFLVTETLQRTQDGWESCHVCSPILGIAEFALQDDEWVIKSLKKDLGEYGAWGELPSHELIQIGPEKYGILFHDGYTSQGITSGSALIAAEAEGKFKVIADFETEFSNEGFYFEGNFPERAYAYNSKMEFVDGENTDFYDLLVRTEGTKPLSDDPESEQIRNFVKKRVFVFEKGKYVLTDSVVSFVE